MKLPYIIAEIGLNHGGDYRTAVVMAEAAILAGANAVKFQYVKADRLVSRQAPSYFQQTGGAAATQHGFFARSDGLMRRDYENLRAEVEVMDADFLCTVFDVESVHWIAPLVPAFKVASADIINIPLLEAIHATRRVGPERTAVKPVYLSTGAATQVEIQRACEVLDYQKVWLLHCVLAYPTPLESAQLVVIQDWARNWPLLGYSDHTLFNLDVLTTAWLLGATVIEKHFTLDKALPGNDHYHSMDPTDLRALIAKFKELQAMIGDGEKRVLPIEEAARLNARQSWHAARDLPVGWVLTEADVVLKRPATGLPPDARFFPAIVKRVIQADEPITPDALQFTGVLVA